jgi:hypothetical protein
MANRRENTRRREPAVEREHRGASDLDVVALVAHELKRITARSAGPKKVAEFVMTLPVAGRIVAATSSPSLLPLL